jgi:hypothetical protein
MTGSAGDRQKPRPHSRGLTVPDRKISAAYRLILFINLLTEDIYL